MTDMKKILVVIDCQNDFIDGSLRNEEAIAAVPRIVERISSFDGDEILVTMDTHSEDYLSTKEGEKLPVEHCIKGTAGWELNGDIAFEIQKAELRGIPVRVFEKPTFGSYDLAGHIRDIEGEPEIEFIGFCTDICVVSNVLMVKAAVFDRAVVKVDSACCAGVTPATHLAALDTMRMCQVEII